MGFVYSTIQINGSGFTHKYKILFSENMQTSTNIVGLKKFENTELIRLFEECIAQVSIGLVDNNVSLIMLYDVVTGSIIFFGRFLFFTPISEILIIPFVRNSETGEFSSRMETYLLLIDEKTLLVVKKFDMNSEITAVLVSEDHKVTSMWGLSEYRKEILKKMTIGPTLECVLIGKENGEISSLGLTITGLVKKSPKLGITNLVQNTNNGVLRSYLNKKTGEGIYEVILDSCFGLPVYQLFRGYGGIMVIYSPSHEIKFIKIIMRPGNILSRSKLLTSVFVKKMSYLKLFNFWDRHDKPILYQDPINDGVWLDDGPLRYFFQNNFIPDNMQLLSIICKQGKITMSLICGIIYSIYDGNDLEINFLIIYMLNKFLYNF